MYHTPRNFNSSAMLLHNLNLDVIDEYEVRAVIINELSHTAVPNEQDVKDALAQLYMQACNATASLYYVKIDTFNTAKSLSFSIEMTGESLWKRLRVHLCKTVEPEWGINQVVRAVLEFMATFIPGGVIILHLVTRMVRYILAHGYYSLCPLAVT